MFEFKSVGKDIKLWAKVRAYLIFIPSLLIAIVCWLIGAFGGNLAVFLILTVVGAVIVLLGYIAGKLSALHQYGYGEMIDQMTEMNMRLQRIESDIGQQIAYGTNGEPRELPDGSWICTCGRKNTKIYTSCACGKSKRDIKF